MAFLLFGGIRSQHIMCGIDIGSSAIKLAEVLRSDDRLVLQTYGEYEEFLTERTFRPISKATPSYSDQEIGEIIRAIAHGAKVQSKEVFMSLPSALCFTTTFELPALRPRELETAVLHEARQRIPVPFGEVEVDWSLLSEIPQTNGTAFMEILLVAVPKEIIAKYLNIATVSGFKLAGVEPEFFSLVRSLLGGDQRTILLLDFGASDVSINIIEKGNLLMSHTFWVGGNELTLKIMQSTGQNAWQAEYYKRKVGVKEPAASESVTRVLLPLVDAILREGEKVIGAFQERFQKDIAAIMLSGGSASLPGFRELVSARFHREVIIGNPFFRIFYPPLLTPLLPDLGPRFAISIGLALRGFE